ncbi:MAG: LemA family protein [Patescibacteria group bacterium]
MKKTWIIVIVVALLVAFYAFGTYNRIISLDEKVTADWQQVEVQYQRRFDLIPNIVNAVKGAMVQEQTIFLEIADARSRYAGAATVDDKVRAAGQLDSALSRLLVITENYPILKSSENVQSLIAELAGTENRIAIARRDFNQTVNTYNLATRRFPSSLVASMFGYSERPYFEAAPGTELAPKVELQ